MSWKTQEEQIPKMVIGRKKLSNEIKDPTPAFYLLAVLKLLSNHNEVRFSCTKNFKYVADFMVDFCVNIIGAYHESEEFPKTENRVAGPDEWKACIGCKGELKWEESTVSCLGCGSTKSRQIPIWIYGLKRKVRFERR